jgi:hypothetical protein
VEPFEFEDEFCRFIQKNIPAVAAAELLLLFHAHPDRVFTLEEAVARLGPGIELGDAAAHIRLFEAQGLVVPEGAGYSYRAGSELAAYVEMLDAAYTRRPVTLIRIIYAFRDSSIKSFSDAFRLRK